MTHSHIIRGRPPTPRLYHCPPGSTVSLAKWDSDTKTWIPEQLRTIDYIKGRHAVMSDGLIVTLCHPVDPDCMKFGDGDGWRPK